MTTAIAPLHRTLEQELLALLRGASLECPVCGEFVLHEGAAVRCPECELTLHGRLDPVVIQVEFGSQTG
jgi:rubrerythrin